VVLKKDGCGVVVIPKQNLEELAAQVFMGPVPFLFTQQTCQMTAKKVI